jgi:hypothetical protein
VSVAAAVEVQVLDAILSACAGIGTPAASWLTTPNAIVEGVPNDKMGALTNPRLFLQHVASTPASGSAGTTYHRWTLTFNIWCCAQTQRGVLSLKADVLRAVYAAEGTFTASFKQPLWPGDFTFHDELVKAGIWLGTQTFTIDIETDHASP